MTSKQIHIEKYDIDTWEKEKKPYVMICTDVIQRISMKHSQAFLMWVFLESLPPTWKPNRYHLMEHFVISESTYERHMAWLNTVGLIEYRQNRGNGGAFGKGHLVVLNGTKFNPDAECYGTVKIGGTVVNKKKAKVIHISQGNRTPKFDDSVKPSTNHASTEDFKNPPNPQITEPRSNGGHINTTVKNKKEYKKTNNPVSVFSDKQTVTTHIEMVVANRENQEPLDDDILDQGAFYAYEKNDDKSFDAVNKRINIFLKKVREGKWLIPQGWNGITSQSIRESEEQYEANKREQYAQEAQAFQGITGTIAKGEGLKSFSAMFQKLKDEVNGKTTNDTGMQKQAV